MTKSASGHLIDGDGLTVEDFGLPDNLMMIHTLDLHGARLVTPRQRPADIWHDLTSFEACVALAADRASKSTTQIELTQIGLTLADRNHSETSARKRVDVLLVERGLFESRARARAAIDAGGVTADGRPVLKASEMIAANAELSAQPAHPWVSRGGVKLAGALELYPIEIEGHVCLDVGASTGGFTEVLLQNGASLVFAIDVGRGQLHPSLRDHPRIVSMEETDIRKFEGKRLPARPDIVVIDVSFISLKAVLPVALSLAAAPMHLLALIKPQFEAERKHSKHGIIRNAMVHQEICDDITAFADFARLHRYPGVSLADHRRRRQYRILHGRAPWLTASASSSTMSAITATASPSPTAATSTCRIRWAAKRSTSVRFPATIPTAGDCSRSRPQARSGSRRSVRISASAAAARSSIGTPRPIAPGSASSW